MTPHRERAIAWAQTIVNDPRAVYLDLETCGLGDDAMIVDIAIVGQDGAVLFDSLIDPAVPIPAAATDVHGITDDDVRDAPIWFIAYADVAQLLSDRRVVVYNAPYDSKIIAATCAYYDLPLIVCDWQDALKAYSDFDGTPGKYPYSRKWWKLSDAAARFGIEPGTHRALADTLACRALVHAMASYSEPPSLSEPVAVTVQPSLFAVETPVDAEKWRR